MIKERRCKGCQTNFKGYRNQRYCSIKCRDHQRWLIRKNDTHYIIKQNIRSRRYDLKHKAKRKAYQKSAKFRIYQNKWRNDRKYWLQQYSCHAEIQRQKIKKYRRTPEGKKEILLNNERRRKKFPKAESLLTKEDLAFINQRDKVCVYCGCDFIEDESNSLFSLRRPTYDHINCMKPLSITNTVRACKSCNSSKSSVQINNLIDWIKRKKFKTIAPIVYELLAIDLTNTFK